MSIVEMNPKSFTTWFTFVSQFLDGSMTSLTGKHYPIITQSVIDIFISRLFFLPPCFMYDDVFCCFLFNKMSSEKMGWCREYRHVQ